MPEQLPTQESVNNPQEENVPVNPPQVQEQVDRYLAQAKLYCTEKQWEQAIASCRQCLELAPQTAEAYKLWGNALQGSGDNGEAMNCYKQALSIFPQYPEVHANIGTIHAGKKQWEEALSCFEKAIAINPLLASVYRNIEKVFTFIGDKPKAREYGYIALILEPEKATEAQKQSANSLTSQEKAQLNLDLGNKLAQRGEIVKATDYYRQAVELDENLDSATQKLKEALEKQQQVTEEPQILLTEVTEEKQETAATYLEQARTGFTKKNWEEVISASERCVAIEPETAEAYKLWGNALQSVGKQSEALEKYQKALEIEPKYGEVYANIGSLYLGQQKLQEAISYYEKALEINPKLGAVYRNLQKVLNSLGAEEKAREYGYIALILEPESATETQKQTENQLSNQEKAKLNWELAEKLEQKGETEKAKEYYLRAEALEAEVREKAVVLTGLTEEKQESAILTEKKQETTVLTEEKQATAATYLEQARAGFTKKNWEEVISASERCVAIEPETAEAYKLWGNALQSVGKQSEALEKYQKALEIEPKYGEVYANIGSLYIGQQKLQEAISYYEKALEINPKLGVVYRNLQKVLSSLGAEEKAREYGYIALILEPESATENQKETEKQLGNQQKTQVNLELGNKLEQKGYINKATECYRRAVGLEPDSALANQKLAEILKQQGEFDESVFYYRQAIAINASAGEKQQQQQVDAQEIEKYLQQARASFTSKNWQEVIKLTQHCLNLAPETAEAYKLLGNALQSLGQYSEALETYQKALAIAPKYAEVYANIGSVYVGQKKWQEAISYYQKSVSLNPHLAAVYRNLEKVWLNINDEEKALESRYKALSIEPERATAEEHYILGEKLLAKGKQEEAIACYRQALKFKPNYFEACQKLAELLTQSGQLQEAINYYRLLTIIQSDRQQTVANASPQVTPEIQDTAEKEMEAYGRLNQIQESPEFQVKLGNWYAKKQQWEESIACYKKAIDLNPKFTEAYRNLVKLLSQIGQKVEAQDYRYKLLTLEPNSVTPEEHFELGNSLLEQGKIQTAINSYLQAIKLKPNYAEVYLKLGDTLKEQGKLGEAINYYEKLTQLYPNNPEYQSRLAQAFTTIKDWDQAQSSYEKLLQLAPKYSYGYYHLSYIFIQQKHWQEAITLARKSIELTPDFCWSYNNLGNALSEIGEWEEAEKALRKAIEIDANIPWSHYKLGQVLEEQQKWDEAIAAYQTSIKIQPDLPSAHRKLGEVYYRRAKADLDRAVNFYLQATQIDPQDVESYHRAIEIQPRNAQIYLNLAGALVQQGKLDEAIVIYQMALAIKPGNNEIVLLLAQILLKKQPELNLAEVIGNLLKGNFQEVNNLIPVQTSQLLLQQEDDSTLVIPKSERPIVSVIIPVYNKIEYTLKCLRTMVKSVQTDTAFEVIVVNDCSNDNTQQTLETIEGLTLVNHTENLGFVHSCNQGAVLAKGQYLYFLNNDTELLPKAIENLLEVFMCDRQAGAVGSKLIYPNNALQEAGGIIWNDGTGWNYGRNQNPHAPEYNYLRPVDYCSGASLMVKREIFEVLEGFASELAPAYYEDTDLCFAIRHKLGLKVIYQPKSEVIHYEGVTSGISTLGGVKRYQVINLDKFREKWRAELAAYPNHSSSNVAHAARKYLGQQTILVIDSYMPCYDKESGSRRLFQLLKIFKELNYHVIFVPDNGFREQPYTAILQDLQIETLYTQEGYGTPLEEQIRERLPLLDFAWICRPELNEKYAPLIRQQSNVKIIYDTIDLHYLRLKRAWELSSQPRDLEKAKEWVQMQAKELKLALAADLTITVTPLEKEVLGQQAVSQVAIIPNIHQSYRGEKRSFSEREGLLFIGSYNHTPNVDAVEWLCQEIMPVVWLQNPQIKVTLLGTSPSAKVLSLANERVTVPGYIEDVASYFLRHRIFVSPLRYGAGMKGKIGQSLEYGLPIISTAIGTEGMNLVPGKDVLEAETTEEFAQTILRLYNDEQLWNQLAANSENAIAPYSPESVKTTLVQLFKNLSA